MRGGAHGSAPSRPPLVSRAHGGAAWGMGVTVMPMGVSVGDTGGFHVGSRLVGDMGVRAGSPGTHKARRGEDRGRCKRLPATGRPRAGDPRRYARTGGGGPTDRDGGPRPAPPPEICSRACGRYRGRYPGRYRPDAEVRTSAHTDERPTWTVDRSRLWALPWAIIESPDSAESNRTEGRPCRWAAEGS